MVNAATTASARVPPCAASVLRRFRFLVVFDAPRPAAAVLGAGDHSSARHGAGCGDLSPRSGPPAVPRRFGRRHGKGFGRVLAADLPRPGGHLTGRRDGRSAATGGQTRTTGGRLPIRAAYKLRWNSPALGGPHGRRQHSGCCGRVWMTLLFWGLGLGRSGAGRCWRPVRCRSCRLWPPSGVSSECAELGEQRFGFQVEPGDVEVVDLGDDVGFALVEVDVLVFRSFGA